MRPDRWRSGLFAARRAIDEKERRYINVDTVLRCVVESRRITAASIIVFNLLFCFWCLAEATFVLGFNLEFDGEVFEHKTFVYIAHAWNESYFLFLK